MNLRFDSVSIERTNVRVFCRRIYCETGKRKEQANINANIIRTNTPISMWIHTCIPSCLFWQEEHEKSAKFAVNQRVIKTDENNDIFPTSTVFLLSFFLAPLQIMEKGIFKWKKFVFTRHHNFVSYFFQSLNSVVSETVWGTFDT